MANEIATRFDTTVQVKRLSPDEADVDKEGYAIIVSSLPCHIQPMRPEISAVVGMEALFKSFRLWTSVDADVKEQDLIIEGSSRYIVTGVQRWNVGGNPHKLVTIEQAVGS